jgi:hypothetical protein
VEVPMMDEVRSKVTVVVQLRILTPRYLSNGVAVESSRRPSQSCGDGETKPLSVIREQREDEATFRDSEWAPILMSCFNRHSFASAGAIDSRYSDILKHEVNHQLELHQRPLNHFHTLPSPQRHPPNPDRSQGYQRSRLL